MKKWLLNLALAVVVVFFMVQIYGVWTQPDPLPRESAGTDSRPAAPAPSRAAERRLPPAVHYEVIPQKNLFTTERGERSEPAPVLNPKTPEESRFAKNIALFGTLTRDETTSALVSTGGPRRTGGDILWVRVGDKLDQVTVVAIERDRIYVREGASTFEIRLDDRGHPSKKTTVVRTQAPTVITSKAAVPEPPKTAPSPEAQPPPANPAVLPPETTTGTN